MSASPTVKGIIYLVLGIAVFSVQDLILKLLSDRYPLSEAMVLRSLTAFPLMMMIVRAWDGSLSALLSPRWPALLSRGVLNFVAYTAYYLALAALPMATTVALYFTAPLFIVAMAVIWLREPVSLNRWLGVLVGFAGVVVMVRPGTALFDWAALLPVFCGAAYAASMVMARRMGEADSGAVLAFWGNVAFLLCAAALSAWFGAGGHEEALHPSLAFLTRGWVWPTLGDAGLMCACGAIAAVGLTLLTQAYAMARSAVVAPFEYTFAFWGLLWGWAFFGTLPDLQGWVGIAILIGAGLYVLYREGLEAAPQG